MRTLTTAMQTAIARTDGQGFRYLVEITPAGGSTRYLCSDAQTVGVNTYAGEVLSLGTLSDRVGSTSDLRIDVLDNTTNKAAVQLAAEVKVHLWAIGTAISDVITVLWGEISDPLSRNAGKISFDVVSRAIRQDQPITRLLNATDFPGADPDAIGHSRPVIYGAHTGVPCLGIDAGSITNLQLNLTAIATTATVTSTAAFPATGTLQNDIEQMTYTGKTATTFTGLTRGANGTTAVAHDKGATIAEIQTQYDYLVADHPVKAISAVYVDGVRQQGADFSTLLNDAGKAKVRFNTLSTVVRQVNLGINDSIEVLDSISVSSSTDATRTDLASTTNTMPANVGASYTYSVTFNFPTSAANPVSAELSCKTNGAFGASGSSGTVTLYAQAQDELGANVDSPKLLYQLHSVSGSTTIIGDYTAAFSGNVRKVLIYWTMSGLTTPDIQFWDLRLNRNLNASVASSKAGAASKAGTAVLTGNSVADTKIGGIVTVDVEGYADDGLGTYTGTPSSLIQQPDHVVAHMLATYGGATAPEIAGFDAFTGESLVIYLDQIISVQDMLHRIASECRAIIGYSGDHWRMKKRPLAGAIAAVTLTDADIIAQDSGASTLSESRTGLRSVINYYMWRTGISAHLQAWAFSGERNDGASQALYGTRSRTEALPDVPTEAQALIMIDWLLARTANPNRAIIGGSVDLRHIAIEIGDVVRINHSKCGIDITGEVISGSRTLAGNRNGTTALTVEAL